MLVACPVSAKLCVPVPGGSGNAAKLYGALRTRRSSNGSSRGTPRDGCCGLLRDAARDGRQVRMAWESRANIIRISLGVVVCDHAMEITQRARKPDTRALGW